MEHLVRIPLWSATALGASAALTSPTIPLGSFVRVEGLEIKASSVAGAANVKIEYAIVDEDENVASFDNEPDLVSSTATEFTNPEDVHAVSFPAPLSRNMRIRVTELTGSVADTLITADLICREQIGR